MRRPYATNWGYETTPGPYTIGETTLLMVPQLVPEPSGIAVLLSGAVPQKALIG